MQTIQIPAGSTSQTVYVEVRNVSDNLLSSGLGSGDLAAILYVRRGETLQVAATSDLSALSDSWTSGGIIQAVYGVYRVDLPDAVLASGVDSVVVYVTDSFVSPTYYGTLNIELTNVTTAFSGAAKRDVRSR